MYCYIYIREDGSLVYRLIYGWLLHEIGYINHYGWELISRQVLVNGKFITFESNKILIDKYFNKRLKIYRFKKTLRKFLLESEEKTTFYNNKRFPWWKLR